MEQLGRGRLAAARDFTTYTRTLLSESVVRLALCGLAWALPAVAAPALAAAIGVPVVVSALVARARASVVVVTDPSTAEKPNTGPASK